MARSNSDREQGMEKGKIRVLYIELEGNNQTLQDGLRAVAQMLPRTAEVKTLPKLVQNGATGAGSSVRTADPDLFNQEPSAPEEIDAEEVEHLDAASNGNARRPRGEGAKTDRNAGINPVTDLNFVPNDKPTLKSFFAERAPASDMEQVLVLAYYIQETLGITAFGPGHILTAFKHVGKPIPVDLRQTIRNVKKKKVWLTFTDIDSVRVTTEGENFVKHELSHNGSTGNGGNQ